MPLVYPSISHLGPTPPNVSQAGPALTFFVGVGGAKVHLGLARVVPGNFGGGSLRGPISISQADRQSCSELLTGTRGGASHFLHLWNWQGATLAGASFLFFSFWGQGETRAHTAAEIPLGAAWPDTGELECPELEGPGAHTSPAGQVWRARSTIPVPDGMSMTARMLQAVSSASGSAAVFGAGPERLRRGPGLRTPARPSHTVSRTQTPGDVTLLSPDLGSPSARA